MIWYGTMPQREERHRKLHYNQASPKLRLDSHQGHEAKLRGVIYFQNYIATGNASIEVHYYPFPLQKLAKYYITVSAKISLLKGTATNTSTKTS